MKIWKLLVPAAAVCATLFAATAVTPQANQLWEHRNLGKAFYENPDTHREAVDQLRQALDLAPNSVGERINYGLALLRAGQTDAGAAELIRAQKQDPSIPHTWFNLGIVYKHNGDYQHSIEQLNGMVRLVPNEPIVHYNLGSDYRALGDNEKALPEFKKAEELNPNLAGPHFQLFTLYQRMGNKEAALQERKLFEEAKKRSAGAAVPEDMEWCFYAELYDPPEPRPSAANEPTEYSDRVLSTGWDAAHAGMEVLDTEGNGHADLLVWSPQKVQLLRRGAESAQSTGLEQARDVRNIAVGDYDNDGLPDLCVLTGAGATLFHNSHGQFTKAADLPDTVNLLKTVWFDYDHDNDLDIVLLGAKPLLLRNDGGGKFEDKTATFPFQAGTAIDGAVTALRGDTAARDLLVTYADRPAVLYRDKLNEVFEPIDINALPAGSSRLDVQDFNHDGLLDAVAYSPQLRAVQNNESTLAAVEKPQVAKSGTRADFNGDAREDYAGMDSDGALHLYLNTSPAQHWMAVQIEGIKNLKEAMGATVEMKSGAYYGKQVYRGVPVTFATDGRADADTIRITWPNGLIQNETRKKSDGALKITEAQRLSGSCPMVFSWNGQQFQFISDVLGVAPLGASSGDGSYFPVDHDEYIQIPGSALKEDHGRYQVRITEELHEVSYLDQAQLVAVDHPTNEDVYTNDKFKSPPYPQFRLFGDTHKVQPIRATDDRGNDVTRRVLKQDRIYPDAFLHDATGVAAKHKLDLDFGEAAPNGHAVLILNGWIDWADGSAFLAAAQSGKGGLIFPYLQVKDNSGKWQTVIEDMGVPSGGPKTIAVDLTGKFLSASREIRIVTNMSIFWDQAFLLENTQAPPVHLTRMNVESADLRFRGFSKTLIDPKHGQPEQFAYADVMPISKWNPVEGFYTKYGDVESLMNKMDDRMVVMGSGDEIRLSFSAARLPALPKGWTRDYLLLVDGWSKDADANTAFSDHVQPLPYHAMTQYPYRKGEHYPQDPEHVQYVHDYLTRPALRLIRPLSQTAQRPESAWRTTGTR
jgi:tetratricopeptide (TPR) repeat protein